MHKANLIQRLVALTLMIVLVASCQTTPPAAPANTPPPASSGNTGNTGGNTSGNTSGAASTPAGPGTLVNSAGVTLPADAAPLDKQVLFSYSGAFGSWSDWFRGIYKGIGPGMYITQEPLIYTNNDFTLDPGAAESWKSNADLTEWTFTLAKGREWSDGTPVTAKDFVWNFQRAADPKTAYDFGWFYNIIDQWDEVNQGKVPVEKLGVTAPDDYTLVVKTRQPAPYLPALLTYSWIAQPATVQKNGDSWSTNPATAVASGPYILTRFERDKVIEYSINKKYKGTHKGMVEKVVVKFGGQNVPAYQQFLNNEIPVTNIGATPPELAAIEANPKLKEDMSQYNDFMTDYLLMDTYKPPFDNLKVRQAFAKAIDRDALVKGPLKGVAIPAYTMLPPGFPAYQGDALKDVQKFDLAAAKKLLADAGYPDGKGFPKLDLWLRDPSTQTNPAQAIAAMLKENLNVDVNIIPKERGTFMDFLGKRQVQFGYIAYQYDFVDPANLLELWLSRGRQNWKQAKYDELVGQAAKEGDPQKRIQLYQQAEKILVEDVGGIFIDHPVYTQLVQSWFKGPALEKNKQGVRAWRGDQLQKATIGVYITKDVPANYPPQY